VTPATEIWDPEGGPWGPPAKPNRARQAVKHLIAGALALGRSARAPARGVAILAYHNTPADPRHPWWCDFPGHMRLLERLGWRVVRLTDAVELIARAGPPEEPTVAITFDDGWITNLGATFPELARRGWPATVFIPTALVGRRPFLTVEELAHLGASGIELGNHSHSHPDFAATPDAQLAAELEEGSRRIAEWTGRRPEHFCYPFGRFSPAARDVVAAAGFRGACASLPGRNPPGTDPFLLHRLVIDPRETTRRFRVRLAGGYDLMYRLGIA
jgi:peptidoglycan/xylan/chitin deacetylase (PgdA/CDA1 family)